jgi:tetratricopeptide (TPR) repeat protein
MEHLHNPEALSCDVVVQMLESSFDDTPLTNRQKDVIHRHAQNCRDCQNLLGIMHGLRNFSDTLEVADFDEKISSVQKQWQHLRPSYPVRAPRRFIWVASFAAAALLLFGLWQLWGLRGASESRQPSAFAVPCTPAVLVSPVDGVHIAYCRELTTPPTTTRNDAVVVSLTRGSVALSVDPERNNPQPVTVQTPGGEVRVKGTVFAVHVTEQDERVEVFRGTVELWTPNADNPSLNVSAGTGATIPSPRKYTLKKPIREQLVIALKEQHAGKSASHETVRDAAVSDEVTRIQSSEKLNSVAIDNTPEPTPQGDKKTVRTSAGHVESMESLLEAARFCLIENDWTCAQERYSEALRRHPHHPAISAVRISLAKLELRRLNSPQKALGHYNTYLQKNPSGPLVEEALLGTANAHRQMKNTREEIAALRRLLSEFPNSVMALKVQHRLTQLEADQPR